MKRRLPCHISALPTDWTPNTKPSHVLEKLNAVKKQKHEKCIQDLENELTNIRDNSEEHIKAASKVVKRSILNMKQTVEDLINQHIFDLKKGSAYIQEYQKIFLQLSNRVISLCQPVKVEIQRHEIELKRLETELMINFKQALKQASFAMINIGYKLPHDVQAYIENEMTQMNQITLSNHYTYSQLIAQLLNIVISNENRWLKTISDMSTTYGIEYHEYIQSQVKLDTQVVSSVSDESMLKIFAEKISNEFVQISSDIIGVIELMNTFLSQINEGHFDSAQLLDINLLPDIPKRNFADMYNEVCSSFDRDSLLTDSVDTADLRLKWQEYVDLMQEEVMFCKQSILDASHLFDKHFARCHEAAQVFSRDLHDVIKYAISDDNSFFIELHKAIDDVRTSPNQEHLKISMGVCKKIIDTMNQSIHKDFDKQKKTFDKFRCLMNNEVEILWLEINYHLKRQPSRDDVDATLFRGRRSRTNLQETDDKPHLMKEFDADIKALHNWHFGVNYHLRKAANACREKSAEKAETWITQQTIILVRNLEIKRDLIEENYQQIFHHVYCVRLAELIFHDRRLKAHILAITQEIARLQPLQTATDMQTSEPPQKDNTFSKFISDYQGKLKKIETDLNVGKGTFSIKQITKAMESLKSACFDAITKTKEQLCQENDFKINRLLNLNVCFLQSIKFFSEDGNYASDEVPEMKKQFVQSNQSIMSVKLDLQRSIELEFNLALNEVNNIDREISDNITEAIKHYEFKVFLTNHAADVTADLKKETHELVEKSNELTTYVERLQSLAKKNIGKVEYLDDFTENCEYIKTIFQDLYDRLLQVEVFNLNEMFFTLSSSSNYQVDNQDLNIINKLNSKFEQNRLKTNETNHQTIEIKNNFHLVFPSIPEGDNYMARIVRILFESLDLLQLYAEAYYKDNMKNNSDEEQEKYNTVLKKLMIDHMAKYLYFQMQCDETLLEVIINYILELDNLLSFVSVYYKQSIETFIKMQLNVLSANCSAIRKEFLVRKQNLEQYYQQVRDQLKPLHGHPNNKYLLAPLTNQIEEIGEQGKHFQAELDEMYADNKALIDENTAIFEGQITIMFSRLKNCVEQFFILYIEDAHIFNQLKAKFDYFERIINGGECVVPKGSTETMYIEIIDVLNSKLNMLKQSLKISSSHISEGLYKKWETVSIIRDKYSSSECISTENASAINIDVFIKEFIESQLNCLRSIETEKDVLGVCKLWSEIWQNDVDKINSLYLVKYPDPKLKDE